MIDLQHTNDSCTGALQVNHMNGYLHLFDTGRNQARKLSFFAERGAETEREESAREGESVS